MEVTGFSKLSDKILHCHDMQGVEQDYQSAPPYLTLLQSREVWMDPKTGLERIATQSVFPGFGPGAASITMNGPRSVFAMGQNGATRISTSPSEQRNLDLWAVLADWRDASDVHAVAGERFQEYPRTVLARKGEYGEERLFIDPKSGFPVKVDREEPHYLWGQVHVEFIYSIWHQQGGATLPSSSARVVDGFKEITRTIGACEFMDPAKAPSMDAPHGMDEAGETRPLFLQPLAPKRVEVTPHVFLSANPGYTTAAALIGDTIYILDATQTEKRAEQDLEMIRHTFPGRHPMVLVVSDEAWPHVGGLRFWVASGATVVAHRAQREFLTKVIERRWTRAPDLLERNRKSVKFRFTPVDKTLDLAGGKLRLAAIDGVSSEKALMAFLPGEKFLWAGDFIQSVQRPSAYTAEVWQAVAREKLSPERVAAMHIPLSDWSKIEALAQAGR
jgi:hypothetical protein